MNLTLTLLAEIRGKGFGQGAGTLAATENALVLFMLGLICGVVAMTGFFVYLARRDTLEKELPSETEDLLSDLDEEGWEEIKLSKPSFKPEPRKEDQAPRDPWEKDPDWWQKEEE